MDDGWMMDGRWTDDLVLHDVGRDTKGVVPSNMYCERTGNNVERKMCSATYLVHSIHAHAFMRVNGWASRRA